MLIVPGGRSDEISLEADGYSRSALGHIGFLEVLRARGERVVQRHSLRSTQTCGLLVFAEPGREAIASRERLEDSVDCALVTLLVLSKRQSNEADAKPWWSKRIDLLPEEEVERRFELFADALDFETPNLERVASGDGWVVPSGWPEPTVPGDLQLLGDAPDWTPVVWCRQGVLIAHSHDRDDLYVLADPDLIANHGLLRGANAEFVERLIEQVHPGGPVIVDETLHGHVVESSIWEALGRYPFVFVTCHLLIVLALCGWIAAGRYGPVVAEAPGIDPGKGFLVDNVASLIAFGGNPAPSVRRYAKLRLRRLAAELRAPRGLDDAAIEAFVLARLPQDRREQLALVLPTRNAIYSPHAAVLAARSIQKLTEGQ
ncbi:MAG: DUF4350 domain-containing protein [Planctomycetota bacterium]